MGSRARVPKTVAVKMALSIDERTRIILDSQSKIANCEWNDLLQMCNEARARLDAAGEGNGAQDDVYLLYGKRLLRDRMVGLKAQKPFYRSLYSSVSKNVALRLSRAIRDTRAPALSGRAKRLEWPHYNRWQSEWFSLEYDEPGKGYRFIQGAIELSLGTNEAGERLSLRLPLKEPRPRFLRANSVRALRIVREHGIYYAIATVSRQIAAQKPLSEHPRIIALDPGHINPVTGYDTAGNVTMVKRPLWLARQDELIDKTRAKRDHCVRKSIKMITPTSGKTYYIASRRWRSFDDVLRGLLHQRQEQIKTWCYSVANRFYRDYDIVSMGNYSPHGGGRSRGERRSMNNRSLIGHLRSTFGYMAERSGKQFHTWNERDSTRTCANCKTVLPSTIPPNIRIWVCPVCNMVNDRDANAAINGLDRTLVSYQLPCSGHHEINSWCTLRLTEAGVAQVISTPESVLGANYSGTNARLSNDWRDSQSPMPA